MGHGTNQTYFPGNIITSQLNELREEVIGILHSAPPGNEALLILQSNSRTNTGYGLTAGKFLRFKAVGTKLTVCVAHVTASGRHIVCYADTLITVNPF